MIEKIIFNVIAIALFTITLLKLMKKKDKIYSYLLIAELIGMVTNFIELLVSSTFHWSLKLIMYLLAILLPILLFGIAKYKKLDLAELFCVIVATIYLKGKNTDKAKSILNEFLIKNPNSYSTHKLLAQIYEKEGNQEASISEYRKVIEINPKDMTSAYQLSIALNKSKQNELAIEILQDILKQKPEYEEASNLLGEVFCEQERYKEAILVYMTALRYHPGSYDLYYNVGMAYTMLNDFAHAKEFYEKAADLNSLAYHARLNLGQIALMYGDLDEAESYFRQSIKQEDLEAGSYYYLSQIALLKGDEDRAKNYMKVAVELDSKIYKQMQKDPVFIPIRNEIPPPQENQEELETNKKQIATQKEKKVNKHLTKICMLVGSLSNEDLQVIRNRKAKEKSQQREEKQKE